MRVLRLISLAIASFAMACFVYGFAARIAAKHVGGPAYAAEPAADLGAPPATPVQEQPEVLTSGPVHEAFAKPVSMQAQASVVAPIEPPAVIQETPPQDRPQGDHYTWVPGYWAWEGTSNNYLWVSACWRVAPPNMSWVPGYWNRVGGGWEWVAGFWTANGTAAIDYHPAPPAVTDLQPPGPPPVADNIWVPSCWYWREGRYVLRAGYWIQPQAGWLWVPSHYNWTPRGYVFIAGHWDYSLERRGVLFAPVRFAHATVGVGFVFSPSVVVDVNVMTANLFTYPRYCHYYFGDYYDDAFVQIGIFPWFDRERIHGWYDPIFEYDRWHFRAEPDWTQRLRHQYDLRLADRSLRPTRTYRELETRLAALPEARRRSEETVRPLSAVVASRTSTVKFERMTAESRQELTKQSNAMHDYTKERGRWEATTPTVRPATPNTGREPVVSPADRRPGIVAPREVPVAAPERVGVTPSPIVHKRGAEAEPARQPGEDPRR